MRNFLINQCKKKLQKSALGDPLDQKSEKIFFAKNDVKCIIGGRGARFFEKKNFHFCVSWDHGRVFYQFFVLINQLINE